MTITQTPLRISFWGKGTDYPEYFERHGGAVRASVTKDVETEHAAELSAMTALGSSWSFVVGQVSTPYAFQQLSLHPLDLAFEPIDLERRVLGESIGLLVQTFVSVGGFNLVGFSRTWQFVVSCLPIGPARLRELGWHLSQFFIGIQRRIEDLAKKQVKCAMQNLVRLSRMRRIVDNSFAIITGDGSLTAFRELLDRSWNMKRELNGGITNATIDQYCETGKAAGAIRGKLLWGKRRRVPALLRAERHEAVQHAFRGLVEARFPLDAPGSHLVHSELSFQCASDMPE